MNTNLNLSFLLLLFLVACNQDKFKDSPGKSFAKMVDDAQPNEAIHEEIFLEQEETRGIVNHSFAYWEHVKDLDKPKLFNLLKDSTQLANQNGHGDYMDIQSRMQGKLHQFFNKCNDPTYDLWNGGTSKGSSARPNPLGYRIFSTICCTSIGGSFP